MAAFLCAGIVAMPVAAQAQDEAIEEIVVTGSYIKRTTADSPSPLSVVDRAQIENIGAVEIADIVNRMTYNSGSTNVTNAYSGGDNSTGETNINIRNLGLGSTLVLLNGRRSVAANADSGGNAYVSTSLLVPTIAIERVEVLKDGSSALYGSDAVAGVVNFITREDFEGAEFEARVSSDQETWDQNDVSLGGIWGVGNDRGNIVVAAEFLDRAPLTYDDRYDDFGRSGVSTLGNPGTFLPVGSPDPASETFNPSWGPYLAGGGAAVNMPGKLVAGDLDCDLASSLHRQSFRAPTFGTDFAGTLDGLGGCVYDFSPFFSIVGEETRFLSLVTASYDLTDTIETYAEFGFTDQEFSRGNSLFPLVRFPIIPADNPGLINDFQRRSLALTGDPDAIPVTDTIFFGRPLGFTPDDGPDSRVRPVDTETREFVDQHRAVVGFRGDLPFGNNWTFDASFTHSEHDEQARNTDTQQQQLLLALHGFGGPDCNPTLPGVVAGEGGCQYWNPFFSGWFEPDGSPQTDPKLANTKELMDWMVGEIRTVSESRLSVADLLFTGDLLELPAGPLGLAFGFQFRREEVHFDADADSNANNYSFIFGAADFDAQEDVSAAFVEFAVPVTDRIDVNVAGRVEDFEENDETTFDPKITAMWRATDDLTLRASGGTSFRVGSLLQRFGQSTQLINIADPFSGTGLAFRPQIGLGNPDVSPEEATAWNVGLSWAPSGALDGLTVDIDYYDYDYKDLITLEGPVELVERDTALRCPQGLNDDPADGTPDCGLQADGSIISIGTGIPEQVIRDPSNLQLLRVQPTYSNAQELDVSGVDFTIGYQFELGDFGLFGTNLSASWAREWDLTRADGSVIDGVGSRNFGTTIGRSLPEWKANLGFNWLLGRHSAFVLVRYIDAYEDNQPIDDPGADGVNVCLGSCVRAAATGQSGVMAATADELDRRINSWTTVDVQYSYELPAFGFQTEGSRISIGGTNVFNRKPPKVNVDGLFDPFVHDPRGAVWYLRYTMDL